MSKADEQEQEFCWSTNSDNIVQAGFIRKVLGIVSAQLILTTCIVTIFVLSTQAQEFLVANLWIVILSVIAVIIIAYILACYREVARAVPTNYILLLIFTLCESILVASSCILVDPKIVLMAALMTAGLTTVLAIYACTTKTDFTGEKCGLILLLFTVCLILGGICYIFIGNHTLHIILCWCGVLLYSCWLIYDIQKMAGDKTHSYVLDDYVIAAINIYLDIILIFLNILDLLSDK